MTPIKKEREHKRKRTRVAARIKGEGKEASISGFTRDISRGGLFVQTHHPFPPGTEIEVELLHKDRPAAKLKGTVVHACRVPPHLHTLQASGMGVKLAPQSVPPGLEGATPRSDARAASTKEVLAFFGSDRHLLSIRDLSASGAALISKTPLPEISSVRLHFKLSDRPETLVVDGVPVRSRPLDGGTLIAVRFLDPPDNVVALIEDFVRERAPEDS